MTPLLYLAIGFAVERWVDLRPQPGAARAWDNVVSQTVLAVLDVSAFLGLVFLRLTTRRRVRRRADDPEAALDVWQRDFFKMAMLADSLAGLGFVYFLISGRVWALAAGGAAAYTAYALICPKRLDLRALEKSVTDKHR